MTSFRLNMDCNTVLCCTLLFPTLLHCTVLCCTMQCNTHSSSCHSASHRSTGSCHNPDNSFIFNLFSYRHYSLILHFLMASDAPFLLSTHLHRFSSFLSVTRAKSGLIIVGDSSTLRQEKHWGAFVDWCMLEGCYVRQPMKGEVLANLYTVPGDNHIAPQTGTYQPRPIMPAVTEPEAQSSFTSSSEPDSNDSSKPLSAADKERDRQREREERASL